MATRFRTRGSSSNLSTRIDYRSFYCTANCCTASQVLSWVPGNYVVTDVVSDRQTFNDVVVPGFKRKSAKGEVFFNPMWSRKTVLNPALFSGSMEYYGPTWQCGAGSSYRYRTLYEIPGEGAIEPLNSGFMLEPSGHLLLNQLLSSSQIETEMAVASTKLHEKRGEPDFSIWESLAERRETYRLLSNYAHSAKEMARALEVSTNMTSARALRRLRSLGKAGFEAHLMTNLGVVPLMKDLKNLLKAWQKSSAGNVRQTVRGSSSFGTSRSTSLAHPFGTGINTNIAVLETDEVVVRAMSLDEWTITELENFGLSAKGLISLPLDLISLSFVAEWFITLGSFVKAIVPTPSVRQVGNCTVVQRTLSRTNTISSVTANGVGSVISPWGGVKTGTVVEKWRVPSVQAPSIVVRNDFGLDPTIAKNYERIGTAIALVGVRVLKVSYAIENAWRARGINTN